MTGGSSSGSGAVYADCCGAAWRIVLSAVGRCAAAARNAAVSDGSLAGRGAGAALRVVCTMGRVAKSSAGTDADAGVAEGAGFALVGRTPPPMSSSAVQGRSLITSSRLNANRSSSPSSNARFACPRQKRCLRGRCVMRCSTPSCSILSKYSHSSIIWNLPCGRLSDSCIPELVPKREGAGALTICRRRQPLPR